MASLKDLIVLGPARFLDKLYGNLEGNASTATKLQTPRAINGTNFDGTGGITTNIWGTARNITIGSKTKSVNGSTTYNWTHAEIGATVSNTWTAGTTAGPKISTTVNGVTGTGVEIPSASTSASGVVTTGDQRFRGQKYFEYPTITSNATRYQGYYYKSSGGTLVGDHWLDTGDPSKVTQGIMYWRLYSPKATADTTTTGYYEQYLLPAVTIGRSTNASYEIFTSKSYTTLDSRYVNTSGDTMTGKLTLNTTVVDHANPTEQALVINCGQVPSGGTLTDKNAPGIGFHIGSNSWGSLILNGGKFKFIDNTATGYLPVYASTFYGALSGNASTATKLQTPRAINGTNFDGSAAITTANWGTARTLTIGNKGQSVNGSTNYNWELHDILYNTSSIATATSWNITTPGVYYVASSSAFTGTSNPESVNGGTTPYRYGQLIVSRASTGGMAQFYISHNDSSAQTGLGIKFRTGWNSSYLGTWRTLMDSTNYTNWCDSRYINTAGDTMTGALNFANNVWNSMGDDAYIGDYNQAGMIGIKGKNGNTGIYFAPYSGSTAQTITVNGSGTMTISGTVASTFSGNLNGNASTATKLGTSTIGSSTKPIYLNAGSPTAFSSTIGDASTPVYLSGGSITVCNTFKNRPYSYNKGEVYYYTWGGGQDLNWKKVFAASHTATAPSSNVYIGCTVKGTIYHHQGNHNQAEVREYPFVMYMSFIAGTNVANSCTLKTSTTCPTTIIRAVRVATNSFELQVRQPSDWQTMAIQFSISGNCGNRSAFEPVNSSNTSALTNSHLQESIPTKVVDAYNGTVTTFAYSQAGLSTTSWFAAWNGYELRGISPTNSRIAMSALSATNANGYYGMGRPDGDTTDWIRTTNYGIIPYKSGGASALGTSSWPFSNAYINTVYGNLSGKATSAGSADTAAKLTTPRAINGTNFDGSAAITTANWGTARNLTVGNTTKSVNGSAAVSWPNPLKIAYYGSDTASTNGWYKVGTWSQSGHSDTNLNLLVTSGYSRRAMGIIYLAVRCSNTTANSCLALKWLCRYGFNIGDFYFVDHGNNTWSLYVQQTVSQYGRIQIQVLSETGTSASQYNLTFTSNGRKESTAPSGGIASTDANFVYSSTEPSAKYEGMIWLKPA